MSFRATPALLRAQVCELYAQGNSYRQIEALTGISFGAVGRLLHAAGVEIRRGERAIPVLRVEGGGSPTKASQYEGGDSDTPKCPCGGRLSFETWNGYAKEVCRSCSLERPIPSKGVRKYDQRERMERFWAEEDERSEAQKAYTRKPGLAPRLNVRREVA